LTIQYPSYNSRRTRDNIHIIIIQIEVFMYEFFSFRFLTTEAMLPLLPCTERHCVMDCVFFFSFFTASHFTYIFNITAFLFPDMVMLNFQNKNECQTSGDVPGTAPIHELKRVLDIAQGDQTPRSSREWPVFEEGVPLS
jgi:hypothetical protein